MDERKMYKCMYIAQIIIIIVIIIAAALQPPSLTQVTHMNSDEIASDSFRFVDSPDRCVGEMRMA